jgi:sugar O-acyltransferase (sialic acid O-acetyltransferase NeuD family)
MKKLIIVGAGGFGREVLFLVEEMNRLQGLTWEILGFVDDDPSLLETTVNGAPVLGSSADLEKRAETVCVAIAVGNPRIRRDLVRRLQMNSSLSFPNLIHPATVVHPSVRIGAGNIVCQGVVFTVNIALGSFCIVNLMSTIGHDCTIADCCTLAPQVNVSGCVFVGEAVEFGTSSVVLPGKNVAAGAVVGAGAVVTKDVPPGVVVAGVPAKSLKRIT